MQKIVHVAVGVIINAQKQVLVALRPLDRHQGGLWEFPGGKVEANESIPQALARELHEEIGINIQQAEPLKQIFFEYPDKKVLLDVWLILDYQGEPFGHEGQAIKWVNAQELSLLPLPAANYPIVEAVIELASATS